MVQSGTHFVDSRGTLGLPGVARARSDHRSADRLTNRRKKDIYCVRLKWALSVKSV